MIPKSLIINVIILLSLGHAAYSQCKPLDIDVSSTFDKSKSEGVISIDLKTLDKKSIATSLFESGKNYQVNTQKTEFKNLKAGKYLVVVVWKKDEDNFCPFSKEIVINWAIFDALY